MAENYPRTRNQLDQVIRIDVLHDDVLLAIFNFYVVPYGHTKPEIEKWQSLVHVCRRWRSLVFGSPGHLNLQLFCTPETPAEDILDVWPPLPLIVHGNMSIASSEENILVALGHNDRIHEVDLYEVAGSQLEQVLAAMQVPFPKATHLRIAAAPMDRENPPTIPDSFLGGSAPCLRYLSLDGILFLGLSKFLSSTAHLVDLHLRIPLSMYIPPEEMVTCLSVLTNLEKCTLGFQFFPFQSHRATQRSPLATRSILSALTSLRFEGPSVYLEDLVACIESPRLCYFFIEFYHEDHFSIPQLIKFVSSTPALKAPVEVHTAFERYISRVKLTSQTIGHYGEFHVQTPCIRPALQLLFLVQILASSSWPLFTVENLYIEDDGSVLIKSSRVEVTKWWEFLRPFVAVKNMYIFETIAFHIAFSLLTLGAGRSLEVLPALENIFFRTSGIRPPAPVRVHSQGPMGDFVAQRRLVGHSVTFSYW